MSTEPGLQIGQLSPDGLWRWDGARWVSTTPGFAPTPAPRRSRPWIWWVVGGCAVLLVLALIGAGFGAFALVKRFQNGDFSCLPSDFPNYPGASVTNENTQVGNEFSPGDSKRCTIVLDSNDDVATVAVYYERQLAAGDWTVMSSDPTSGVIKFERRSRPQTVGTLTLLGRGQHSEIHVQLDS